MSDWLIWVIIAALGVGTYLIRFSFLGLLGDRELPEWVLRHLRYTAVTILPALITPLVLWPQATGGQPDPARLAAAASALVVGYLTKAPVAAIAVGLVVLYAGLALVG
ncbi:AzlD domain-containing protein [Rhodobacterales bacterium HKCCE2091]|nr:AzlD domain-containing protein [Rhodobacterales bacterium HKCCE2091]